MIHLFLITLTRGSNTNIPKTRNLILTCCNITSITLHTHILLFTLYSIQYTEYTMTVYMQHCTAVTMADYYRNVDRVNNGIVSVDNGNLSSITA